MMTLTRTKFEELIGDLVERSLKPCKEVLKDAGLKASELNGVLMVGGSTRVPLVLQKVEAFFGRKPNTGINPDESVAMGAAIQAGIIGGDVTDVLLLDVTPLTLGIETMGGVRTAMIARNTTIPANKTETFSTAVDNQPSVEIHVLQGEREMAADNKSLGRFMQVSDEDKTLLEDKIKDVKEVLAKADATKDDFEAPSKALQDALMQVGQKIYSQADAAGAPESGEPEAQKADGEDEVQDGEVEK